MKMRDLRRLGLGHRCNLCADAKRLFVSGRHPRLVLAQGVRLAVFNSLDSHFCIEALLEAIDRHGTLKIFSSDQGVQFTSEALTECLKQHGIRIGMNGKGCYQDTSFVKRRWRTVKYECLYIQAFKDGRARRQGLKTYSDWYHIERSHQSLDNQTPDEV
jgi:putative transposase